MDLQTENAAPTWPRELRPPNGLQLTLHGDDEDQRLRVIGALWRSFHRRHKRWASQLADCSRRAEIFVDPESGRVSHWLLKCRHRACPFCGRGRAAELADRVTALVRSMRAPKHVTLTYRHNDLPLDDQLRRLRAAWGKLRRRSWWRRHVAGGVYAVEIKRNADTGRWHPHLHLLVDSLFLPHAELKAEWSRVMEGGLNVWIRRVADTRRAAGEVSKYVAKLSSLRDFPESAILDYVDAVVGRRLIQTFGDCYGRDKLDEPEHADESPATYTVALPRIAFMANRGHQVAVDLASLIARRWPVYRPYLEFAVANLPPEASFERRPLWAEAADAAAGVRAPPAPGTRADAERLNGCLFVAFTRWRRIEADGGFVYDDASDDPWP